MAANEKKGITVKVDAELHAEVRRYLEAHEMTMGDFVSLALQNELHPKNNIREDKNMGNMRTMAFQVPEELFQKIKDYLQRNNMTQKQFVIGLIILASIISNLQFVFRGVSLYVYLVMLILIFGGQRPCGTGLIPLAEG